MGKIFMILDLAMSPDYAIESANKNNNKSKKHRMPFVLANDS